MSQDLQLCLQRERGQHQHQLSALEAAHLEKLSSLPQTSLSVTEPEDGETDGGGVLPVVQYGSRGGGETSEKIRQNLLSALEEVSLDEREGDSCDERREEGVAQLRTQLRESQERCVGLERELEQLGGELRESRRERREERETVEELRSAVESLQTRNAALESERSSAGLAVESQMETLRKQVEHLQEENAGLLAVGKQETSQLQLELTDTRSMNESEY